MASWSIILLLSSFHCGVHGFEQAVRPLSYYAYEGMDCGQQDAAVLPCAQPAEATSETCQKACDECPNCVATVLVNGGTESSARCDFRACDTSCGCYYWGSGQCNHSRPPADASPAPQHQLFAKTLDPHFCRQWAFDHMGVAGRVVKPPRYYAYTGMTCKSAPAKATPKEESHSHMPCSLIVAMEVGSTKQFAEDYSAKAQVQELKLSGIVILRFGNRHEACLAVMHDLQAKSDVKSVELDGKVSIAQQIDHHERSDGGFSCPSPSHATPESCKSACDDCSNCVAVVFAEESNGSSAHCEFRGCDTSCGCSLAGGYSECSSDGPPADALALPHHHLFAKTMGPHFCRQWAYDHHGVAGQIAAVNDLWDDQQRLATNGTSHRSTWSVWYWAIGSSTGLGLISLFHHRVQQQHHHRSLLLDVDLQE